ncbi:MAG: RagB/SusD family nutrient uptake outer membrane protein [Marinoscillum sp.]|uniref:RagB/SusD family nutrient uptake outer membrane protein n=1 Tax=Marinoscillum sp. TaxID=2024838 RepID=UPI0032F92938
MKKRETYRFKNILVSGLLIGSLFSCDNFLDEVPDNRVNLNSLDKSAQLLTNAYSVASPAFTEWMTDNVGFTTGVTIRQSQEQAYYWEDITSGPTEQDTPDFFWHETYNAIAHANEVLAVLDDFEVTSEEEEARKDAIEAEAKLTRAYGHFMLVNLFGEHYTVESSGDGVPYVKTPETVFIETYERESVKKVYNEVEDDLLDGLDKVNDSYFGNSGKYHFNTNAALAFASRFYLFKGDVTRCIQYSTELLGANPGNFIRDLTSEEFQNAKSSITGYPQLYTSPELPGNFLLMRKISLVQRPDFGHGPLSEFYSDLFAASPFPGTTDERENPAFVKGDNALLPVRFQNLFERSSLNSNVGLPYHIAISFSGEEVLLNRAEAYTIQNDLNGALADLNVFVARRYSGGNTTLTFENLRAFFGANNDPSFTDQLILLNYILFERRKEFIIQGLRWFDIKRYGISVTHDLSDGSTISLAGDDLRRILQIPQSAIEVGGLEPNER